MVKLTAKEARVIADGVAKQRADRLTAELSAKTVRYPTIISYKVYHYLSNTQLVLTLHPTGVIEDDEEDKMYTETISFANDGYELEEDETAKEFIDLLIDNSNELDEYEYDGDKKKIYEDVYYNLYCGLADYETAREEQKQK